jgi:hypothetical protein
MRFSPLWLLLGCACGAGQSELLSESSSGSVGSSGGASSGGMSSGDPLAATDSGPGNPMKDAAGVTDSAVDSAVAAVDAGALDAGPAINAFEGAGAFVNQAGPSARKGGHKFSGNTPTTSPSKQACLGCHSAGGGETPFSFAGTVFTTNAGTTPLANAEVRVRNAAGQATLVHTDADGNFFSRNSAAGFPALTAARKGAALKAMSGSLATAADGDCNKCHNGTTTGYIFVQ